MQEITDRKNCVGCSACYNICPKGSITMEQGEDGFLYPVIDENKCVDCHLCKNSCPIEKLVSGNELESAKSTFAVISKDTSVRYESSSGGLFTEFAIYVLRKDGVVFGASYSDDFKSVNHIYVEKEEDLYKLRTSKYVQSSIGNTYKKAKDFLNSGRIVYFSGTPCQIAGLRSFLKKNYDNLITQDIICHGTPSPIVWKGYIELKEKEYNSHCISVCVKNKEQGWNTPSYKFAFENGSIYNSLARNDMYSNAFLSNVDLRNSCYNCNFKAGKSGADITLGDFWGIDNVCPNFNDNKGTSLLIINSTAGQKLFDCIKDNIVCVETDFEESVKGNSSYFVSTKRNYYRENFFKQVKKRGVEYSLLKYTKPTFVSKIKRKIKKVISKIK